jgi:YVTN family beta-propeller protein
MMGSGPEFRLLGPLEAISEDAPVPLGGAQQRALLAILLVHRGEVVGTDRLIDELWGERPPPTAVKAVQGYVSSLRRVLPDHVIVTRGRGYMLEVEPESVDAGRFELLAAAGRQALGDGDPSAAGDYLRSALALWRGEPLADLPFAQPEVARLQEARVAAIEDRIDADLALGRHHELVPELQSMVACNPQRERLAGQLMLALYRSGRQREALEHYQLHRHAMIEELGLEPDPALRDLNDAILRQDPELAPPRQRSARRTAASPLRLVVAAGVLLLVASVLAVLKLTSGASGSVVVGPNSVAAIDPHTNKVVWVTPVGARPGAIVVSAGSLWVANVEDQNISQIDLKSMRAVRVLHVRASPDGLAATRDGPWVVGSRADADSVAVGRIDPQFNVIRPARAVATVIRGDGGAIAADGRTVWIAPSSGLLTRLDAATGRVVKRVDPSSSPSSIAIGAGGVWVADGGANSVTRIDPTGLQTPIPVGNGPTAVATGAGGVWVVDSLDNAVVRIDPGTRAVTGTIPVGRSPGDVAVGAGSVWVANSGDGTVSRINPATGKVTSVIAVGGSPQGIAIAHGRVWVTVDEQTPAPSDASSSGTLRMETVNDVQSVDPAITYNAEAEPLTQATCAHLVNLADEPGQAGSRLVAEVATTLPAPSADGRTYTFTIRDGFRFSPPSNQPVTAQTFKHTFERSLNPAMRSPYAHWFDDIVGASAYMAGKTRHISGIRVGGNKLVVRLNEPEADFLARLTMPSVCAVPPGTPIDPNGVGALASAGPYHITSYVPGKAVVLTRNPNYTGPRPHRFERIELTLGVSSKQAVADIQRGKADFTTLDDNSFSTKALASQLAARYGPGSAAAARGGQRYFATPVLDVDFFILNPHRPLFADARMRRAVNYAIDRRTLASLGNGAGGSDLPADHYLPPGFAGAKNTHVYPLRPNVARARALARGHGRTAVLYICNYPGCGPFAEVVKHDLAAIGLRVRIRKFSQGEVYSRIVRPGEPFDLAIANWAPDYPDPANMLDGIVHQPSFFPAFQAPSYRRAFAAAARLTGPARYLAYGRLDLALARDEAPVAVFGIAKTREFFSPRIGCQQYAFRVGPDLAALCIKRPSP